MSFQFELTDVADEALRQDILAPLRAYNESRAGDGRFRPLVIALREPRPEGGSAVVGGLWGATGYGWLFTQLLVVPEQARGQGVGRRLLLQAEDEARARGCPGAWLDTFAFQARGFYEGLGYQVFGQIDEYPVGHARYFLRKALGPVPA